MIPRNPELIILYVCLKISRRPGGRATMEFPVHTGEPAPLPGRGGSRPLAPAPGPTSGAGVGGRCAGPGATRVWGVGRGRAWGWGGGHRGPAGPGSPGSEAGAQASRLAGHEPRARWVSGSGPRRWYPGTRTSNPGRGTPDPFSTPTGRGAALGQGRLGAATERPPDAPGAPGS